MGISPRHGSHAALPIACDALNARTVAVRKYHCIFCVSSPASRYTCFPARCWSLGCPGGDNLTRIASWRTHRMARRKRNVSDLPYAAPPLSCAAFFVKVQNGFAAASAAERKRGREKASRRCGLFLCLKGEDSHHQFCLQPFPNVVVYAKIDVPALVVQLPHGEAGYVAAEMLQDNLHSVRVALCRCHNDRIRNKGIFRVAGFVTIRPIHQHFPPDIFLAAQKSLSACTVSCFSTYRTAPQSRCRSFPRNSTGVRLCAFLPAKYGLLQEAASA